MVMYFHLLPTYGIRLELLHGLSGAADCRSDSTSTISPRTVSGLGGVIGCWMWGGVQGDIIPPLQGAFIMQIPAALTRTATNVAYQTTTTGDAATTEFRMHMHREGGSCSPAALPVSSGLEQQHSPLDF